MHLVGISYSLCQEFSAINTPNIVAIEIGFQNSWIKIKCSRPNQNTNTKCLTDTVAAPHFSLILLKEIPSFIPSFLVNTAYLLALLRLHSTMISQGFRISSVWC